MSEFPIFSLYFYVVQVIFFFLSSWPIQARLCQFLIFVFFFARADLSGLSSAGWRRVGSGEGYWSDLDAAPVSLPAGLSGWTIR